MITKDMSVEGSLSSEHTYTSLSLVLFKARNIDHPPSDVFNMVNKELFENLTLRSLLHLCTACNMRPTAPMLAVALQNSIPSLTGLPMDNPDAAFYIDIAKRFFAPVSISIRQKTHTYIGLNPGHYMNMVNRYNIEAQQGCFSSGLTYYVHLILSGCNDIIHTKKGRDFIKNIALEWLQEPMDPAMVKVYEHLINVLDHGLVLRKRQLMPGCSGQISYHIKQDEHL